MQAQKISLDTLDSFASKAGVDPIDLLKIDTEGFDLEVLKGGRSLLADGKVKIIEVEASMSKKNSFHVPFSEFVDFLCSLS